MLPALWAFFLDVWPSSSFPALHVSIPVPPSFHHPTVYSAHTHSFFILFDCCLSVAFLPSFVLIFFQTLSQPFCSLQPWMSSLHPRPHLVSSFVSPLLQSLNIIYLIDLDFEGFCCCCGTTKVWRSWWPQWAIYPACTWAGWRWRRRSDGLFGGAVGRWGRGVQGQCWDQTTTLKAWKRSRRNTCMLFVLLSTYTYKTVTLKRPHLSFSAGDDSQ